MQFFERPSTTHSTILDNTALDLKLNTFFALTYGLGVSCLIDPVSDLVFSGKYTFTPKIIIPLVIVFVMYLFNQPKGRLRCRICGAVADVLNIVGYTLLLPGTTALIYLLWSHTTTLVSVNGSTLGVFMSFCVFYIKNAVFEPLKTEKFAYSTIKP